VTASSKIVQVRGATAEFAKASLCFRCKVRFAKITEMPRNAVESQAYV
jgi:hypothetical protein